MDDENDTIIVNLKVIGSLKPNEKIITNDSYLNIEAVGIVPQAIKRWWRGDSRDECLKLIDSIITTALDQDTDSVQSALTGTLKGLGSLKQTYAKCTQTVARIDTIIDKINNRLSSEEGDDIDV